MALTKSEIQMFNNQFQRMADMFTDFRREWKQDLADTEARLSKRMDKIELRVTKIEKDNKANHDMTRAMLGTLQTQQLSLNNHEHRLTSLENNK